MNSKQIARRAKKANLRQAKLKKLVQNKAAMEKKELVFEMLATIRQHFPDLLKLDVQVFRG